MLIQWCGQACFLLTSLQGTRILTDPFNKHLGYPVPRYEVEVITVSHNHYDHNYVRAVPNYQDIQIFREPGQYKVKDTIIQGFPSFHDNQEGQERGINTIFVFTMDGLRLAHLGDLGHTFSQQQLVELGKVDILLIPIGGTYTIGASEATAIIQQLQPKLAIPMHYKTATLRYQLDSLEPFTLGKNNLEIIKDNRLEVSLEKVPVQPKVIILDCF